MNSLTRFLSAGLLSTAMLMLPVQSFASSPDPNFPDVQQLGLGISLNYGKWTGGQVTFVYNPTGAPAGYTDDAVVLARIEAAFAEWSGVCDIAFVRSEPDGIDAAADISISNDGIVVVAWDGTIGGAGLAGPNSTSATEVSLGRWNYVDGTLRLNPNSFDQTGMTEPYEFSNNLDSFESTVAHEAAHVFGLGHSDKPISIMYADPYNSLNHIRNDDIESCRSIYGFSDVRTLPAKYAPPAAGMNTFDTLFLAPFSTFPTPVEITVDDGMTYDENDVVALRWQHLTAGYNDRVTMAMVDPNGYRSLATDSELTSGGGAYGNMSFRRLREQPGVWTAYIYDSTGLLTTKQLTVADVLAVPNEPPNATLTVTENPATREVSLTANVSGDNESDNGTIIWHIPTQGAISVPLGGSSGNDARAVTFNDSIDREIFVEINDDSFRYDGSTPGGAPAGVGFQRLLRHFSSGRNLGPDHDGDNSADILWRNGVSGDNFLYRMKGSFIFAGTAVNRVSNTDWVIAGTGDYNGDGRSDILWRNVVSGENHMYLMNGSTITSSTFVNRVSNTDWKIVGGGDYNGDGNSDVLWRNSVTGENHMYLMNGSTITSSTFVNRVSNTDWKIVGSGDYNGDGRCDILWRNDVTGQNWMYLMNGAVISTSSGVNTVSNLDYRVVGSGDYNGDGSSDILWRNIVSGDNWMYLMNGTMISFSAAVNRVSNTDWKIVGSGDYNADSRSDILLRNSVTGDNQMYQMSGNVIVRNIFVNKVGNTDWSIVNP